MSYGDVIVIREDDQMKKKIHRAEWYNGTNNFSIEF